MAVEAGLPPLLRDLRWAYAHCYDHLHPGKLTQGTEQQEEFVRMWQNDRKEFLRLLQAEEKGWREEKARRGNEQGKEKVKDVVRDEGTERVLGLVDRWLDEWETSDEHTGRTRNGADNGKGDPVDSDAQNGAVG